MTLLKHNWGEVRDRYRAFWRGEPLDRPPVIFDTVGPWRHPMYNGVGYDYTRYGEDTAAFCPDFRAVWEVRAAFADDTVPCIAPQMGGAIEAALLTVQAEVVLLNPLADGTAHRWLNYWYLGARPLGRSVHREHVSLGGIEVE